MEMRLKFKRILCCSLLFFVLFFVHRFIKNNSDVVFVDVVKARMAQRLESVSSVCQKYHIIPGVSVTSYSIKHHPPAPQYSVFYFQKEKRLAYCPIYKAASTSMLHWLLDMKGITAEDIRHSGKQISDMARQYYPSVDYPAADDMLKESKTTFMVVRHPFERLLSAYRDKLSNSTINREHGSLHFYDKYGRKIVQKYRPKDSQLTQVEPTFEEFVRYLIDTDLTLYADDHWIPYYLFCTPCLVHYDVIIHFETLQSDVQLLLDRMGDELGDGPEWKHVTTGGKSNPILLHHHFGQLKKSTLEKLHTKFQFDFELFGYSPDAYISMARDG